MGGGVGFPVVVAGLFIEGFIVSLLVGSEVGFPLVVVGFFVEGLVVVGLCVGP